ncbi:MAG: hypothetical protein ACHP7O_14650 [Burkholderiales bacterium]
MRLASCWQPARARASTRGARELIKACPVTEVAVDDAGVVRDIDTEADFTV